jgi:hypothetical protein
MENNMKIKIQTLHCLGTMAAIQELFHEDCTLEFATVLMVADAGANRAADLVYTRSTSTQAFDEALDDLFVFGDTEADHLIQVAFYAAFDACEEHYLDSLPCP